MWLGEITTKLVTLTFCFILMSRVEELLAGGDADVEDLDSDGRPLFSFVNNMLSALVLLCCPLVLTCCPLVLLLIHLQFQFFLFSGATPIILAAIGGHLPLVQVSLHR